jgi:hypothetical protein
MSARLQPPTHHWFKAGEAVLYLGTQCQRQPLVPIRAVIIRDHSTWIRWPDGHISSVDRSRLVYRGHCDVCAVPAVLDRDQLVCPLCGHSAIDCPPPDDLVVRHFPLGIAYSQMAAHRATVHPDWTWRQAYDDASAVIAAMDATADAYAGRLGLPVLKWNVRNWEAEFPINVRMRFSAYIGDEAAYRAAYHELARIQQETSSALSILDTLLDFILDQADDTPGRPSQRLVLPPLDLQRTADDSEPDGADDLTRWLDQQFGRAA